ncbi:MAG TPA: hypothetical protein VFQ53_35220 [Kofleriaceae bacterium]|nr:hypothetical protein [Kofleriaceae bacterium]
MSEHVIAVFPDRDAADRGARALEELRSSGRATLYGAIVVRREPDGELAIEHRCEIEPARAGVGSLVGGLIGLFGARDSLFWRAHLRTEISDELLSGIIETLVPGTHAVIAEIGSESSGIIESRLAALGATVLRQIRYDFSDDLLETARAHELLQELADTARGRLRESKKLLEAKLAVLEQQAATATAEVRSQIERRIADLRGELDERQHRIAHAWQAAKQALREDRTR